MEERLEEARASTDILIHDLLEKQEEQLNEALGAQASCAAPQVCLAPTEPWLLGFGTLCLWLVASAQTEIPLVQQSRGCRALIPDLLPKWVPIALKER